jgi:prepilin-type processing-associated H-X9-DG protein
VELLVVIGIIAILVGILLPALGKARRSAQGAACLSNLRQLSNAVVMYTSENNEWMPVMATKNNYIWNSGSGVAQTAFPTNPANGLLDCSNTAIWIAWYRQIDPITGINSNASQAGQDQNITYSGLAKYLAIPFTPTSYNGAGGLPISNTISDSYDHVFICPGDTRTDRPGHNVDLGPPPDIYRYSYSMNGWISLPIKFVAATNLSNLPAGARVWGIFNGKMTSIRQPSNIVLFICEDSQQIDDGYAVLDASQWATGYVNTVSGRHTSPAREANQNVNPAGAGVNQDGYGNASFCDGHAELVSRKDVLRAVHSGNPYADPAGF